MKTKQINEESHESIQGQSYGNFLFRGQFLQRILQSHRREGEILNFVITPGNTDDSEPLKDEAFLKKIKGKLYADKGYISKQLTEILFIDGIHLVTRIKSNMKNTLVELKDKMLLRKRSVIETVNDELKTMCQIEHSRRRSLQPRG